MLNHIDYSIGNNCYNFSVDIVNGKVGFMDKRRYQLYKDIKKLNEKQSVISRRFHKGISKQQLQIMEFEMNKLTEQSQRLTEEYMRLGTLSANDINRLARVLH